MEPPRCTGLRRISRADAKRQSGDRGKDKLPHCGLSYRPKRFRLACTKYGDQIPPDNAHPGHTICAADAKIAEHASRIRHGGSGPRSTCNPTSFASCDLNCLGLGSALMRHWRALLPASCQLGNYFRAAQDTEKNITLRARTRRWNLCSGDAQAKKSHTSFPCAPSSSSILNRAASCRLSRACLIAAERKNSRAARMFRFRPHPRDPH